MIINLNQNLAGSRSFVNYLVLLWGPSRVSQGTRVEIRNTTTWSWSPSIFTYLRSSLSPGLHHHLPLLSLIQLINKPCSYLTDSGVKPRLKVVTSFSMQVSHVRSSDKLASCYFRYSLSGRKAFILENKNHFSFSTPRLESVWVQLSLRLIHEITTEHQRASKAHSRHAAVLVMSKSTGFRPLLSPSVSVRDDQGQNLFL